MKNSRQHFLFIVLLAFLPLSVLLNSCNKEEDQPQLNEENEAFYEAMKEWYYWTDNIPNINPSSYSTIFDVLEAIVYKPLDRWSFIADWDEFYAYINNTEFVGYGVGFGRDNQGKTRINFIYNNVPMYDEGVRRGWILEAVNGNVITPETNISSLLGPNQPGVNNDFLFTASDGSEVSFSLEKEVLAVNTVLHHEVIEQGGLKVGYLVLQNFSGSTKQELADVFQFFSEEQIDDLILDLRYNGGGLTSVAQQLSSLIAGSELAGEPFARYYYNANKQDRNRTEFFTQEAGSLGLDRLVVIATGASASASEMVINGLKPYMDVYIVGSDTYGKPMGADVLRFNEVWAVAPITISVKNADDEGEFFDGIPADIPANDGLSFDFGDLEEPSLQQSLAFLTSGITKGEALQVPVYKQPWEELTGLRRWIGGF